MCEAETEVHYEENLVIASMEDMNKILKEINEVKQKLGLEININPARTVSSIKDQLMERFRNYKQPWMTPAGYDLYSKQNIHRLLSDAKERSNLRRLQGREDDTADSDYWRSIKKFTIESNNAVYGYNFVSKQYDMKSPLAYQKQVEWDDFAHTVQHFDNTGSLSLPASLLALLETAEARGLESDKLAHLFYLFAKKYYPQLQSPAYVFYQQKDAKSIFSLLLEEIDPATERKKINLAREKIVRKVGQPIHETMAQLKSLGAQMLTITDVNIKNEERDQKASNIALHSLRDFVSAETYRRYEKHLFEKLSQGENLSYTERIRKVTELEEQYPTEVIQSSKAPSSKSFDTTLMAGVNRVEYDRRPSRGQDRARTGYRKERFQSRSRSFSTSRSPRYPRRQYDRRPRDGRRGDQRSRSASRDREPRRWGSRERRSFDQSRRSFGGRDRSRGRSFSVDRSRSQSWDRRSRDRSQGRDRRYGDRSSRRPNDSNDRDRRSETPGGGDIKDPGKDGRCVRCNSSEHKAASCFRYKKYAASPCDFCLKHKKLKLMHDERFCNMKKDSSYRSPSLSTRSYRVNQIRKQSKNTGSLNKDLN